MRHRRAVEKLRELADACHRATRLPLDEPFLHEAYVFGDVLTDTDPIEFVQVAFTLNLPPEEVTWCAEPEGTPGLADTLRVGKGGFEYWWRSRHTPVANHYIRDPVRFWSLDGTDEAALDALRDHRFDDLPRLTMSPQQLRRQTKADLDRALDHLRSVRENYWDRDWRNQHRRGGRYPEDHLFRAADGYLGLLDTVDRQAAEEGVDDGRD